MALAHSLVQQVPMKRPTLWAPLICSFMVLLSAGMG